VVVVGFLILAGGANTESRSDVYVLGETYAFAVIWSCAFNAVSAQILRYSVPTRRGSGACR
jgi:hypothetical protein